MVAMLLLVGCEPEPTLETCATGEVQTWVVNQLAFAERSNGVVAGFDIDDHDSTSEGDSEGCGHADLLSPHGEHGVDNNISGLLPVLNATEAVAVGSLITQSIASGELLITLAVDGVDDWLDDDCVDLSLGRGGGVPLVGPDGTLLDHQTLVPVESPDSATGQGFADQGRVTVEGLEFNLPLDILNAELDFQISRGHVQLQRRYDGAVTGVLGGVIPISQVTEILVRDDVNLAGLVPLVEATADVKDETGACTMLSIALEFEAIPVFLAESPPE